MSENNPSENHPRPGPASGQPTQPTQDAAPQPYQNARRWEQEQHGYQPPAASAPVQGSPAVSYPGTSQQPPAPQHPTGPQLPANPYGRPAGTQPGYGPQKSRLAAGLLGIFLGVFGVHRFYLGHTTIGVVQLVLGFVTFGTSALWGFVEGILILARTPGLSTDARGVPLRD